MKTWGRDFNIQTKALTLDSASLAVAGFYGLSRFQLSLAMSSLGNGISISKRPLRVPGGSLSSFQHLQSSAALETPLPQSTALLGSRVGHLSPLDLLPKHRSRLPAVSPDIT